jgi:hypothetical protein
LFYTRFIVWTGLHENPIDSSLISSSAQEE